MTRLSIWLPRRWISLTIWPGCFLLWYRIWVWLRCTVFSIHFSQVFSMRYQPQLRNSSLALDGIHTQVTQHQMNDFIQWPVLFVLTRNSSFSQCKLEYYNCNKWRTTGRWKLLSGTYGSLPSKGNSSQKSQISEELGKLTRHQEGLERPDTGSIHD